MGFMDSFKQSKAPAGGDSKPSPSPSMGMGMGSPEPEAVDPDAPSEEEMAAAKAIRSAPDEASLARALKSFLMACGAVDAAPEAEPAPMPGAGK
jgi:hypothetical protein